MAQYAVWTCLADAGLGASLQHYNPSIDADISKVFEIPKHWLLRAQLVFGSIEEKAAEKEHYKDEERFMIYA
ncbi:putative oxidoreductase (fatty acid repression mutant protein) [Acinetobacter johnsonii]|nr:putative oxidoreductase (fatty acid repression mutant protein) [Acinetobacter johnsonii]